MLILFDVSDKESFKTVTSSMGDQEKWVIGDIFLKRDTLGYEGLAEVLVSELESRIVNRDFSYVDYKLCNIYNGEDTSVGCYSHNFLKEDESFISVYDLIESFGKLNEFRKVYSSGGKDVVRFLSSHMSDWTGISEDDILKYFSNMVRLDYLILNEDRHYRNFGVVYSEENGYSLSKIFDNGLSLLSNLNEYGADGYNVEYLIRRVKSRTFSTSFKKQVNYFSGFDKLKIRDVDYFGNFDIEKYEIPYSKKIIYRALYVIRKRLSESKGIVWEEA